jgi:hypothetical protein
MPFKLQRTIYSYINQRTRGQLTPEGMAAFGSHHFPILCNTTGLEII